MFDFSNMLSNLEGTSLWNIISIALVSFVLCSLIALTFEKPSHDIDRPRFFIQSLILLSIPVATVIQAIGNILARGLGISIKTVENQISKALQFLKENTSSFLF